MSRFDSLPEFDKEKKKLSKKFRSILNDLSAFEQILLTAPTGIGKNFTIMHHENGVQVIKARLACRALKDRSLRVIYAYHEGEITFMYLELYSKGSKENEDRKRIDHYLARFRSTHQ